MGINKEISGLDNPVFENQVNGLKLDSLKNGNGVNKVLEVPELGNEPVRAKWGNDMEFLMSCIAMSVGLGNIWRFPFTAYENGGGAFLIPYIIVLTVIGRPLYYLEMTLGQFSQRGGVKIYNALAPGLRGVGYAQVVGSSCVATYYCSLMSLTLFYLVNSFTGTLPWTYCRDEWSEHLNKLNKTCVPAIGNDTSNITQAMSSSELYFSQEVLKEVTDISEGIGLPDWKLTLCLFISWAVTFMVSRKGVKSSGKWSYFLALFPYVIMISLLIRAATLEGSANGMYYFIKTDWNKLASADVWYAAVTQCFFSLNVGFGSIIMYSSYNDFEHNINRDALVVTTLDTFTSLLSGVTIFGILGNLAHHLGVTPDEVINSGGTGLAFISYPDAISKFDVVPWLFAILFFVMLFVLGVGSLVALQGCANVVISDAYPDLASWKVSLGTATAGFLIGLMYVTPGGQFMLNLVDHFGGTFVIFLFCILETIGVVWIYGIGEFCLDIEFMLKRKVGAYWRLTWGLITPVALILIFVYFLVKLERLTFGDSSYPDGILVFGWSILAVPVIQLLYWVFASFYQRRKLGLSQAIKETFSSKNWGPSDPSIYKEWKAFKEEAMLKAEVQPRSWLRSKCSLLIGR